MANKQTDERSREPRDTDPAVGADDSVERARGTAEDEGDDIEDADDDEVDEDEEDEGTF
jgi:hypothetical protein